MHVVWLKFIFCQLCLILCHIYVLCHQSHWFVSYNQLLVVSSGDEGCLGVLLAQLGRVFDPHSP